MFANGGERIPLKDLAEITAGPSGSLLERLGSDPNGVPVVSPSDITDWHEVDVQNLRRLPRQDAVKLDRFELREDDIVIVRQGSLGRLARIGPLRDQLLYNSSCARIRVFDGKILPEYLTVYLSYPPVQAKLISQALPGTVQSLNSAIMGDFPVVVPRFERQREIVEVVSDINDLMRVHSDTVGRLERLRLSLVGELLGRS